jgi:hypothetical protein
MSQYPNPDPGQQPPPPGAYPPQYAPMPYGQPAYTGVDPLAPAKRAGMLMIVLGVIGLLCGGAGVLAAVNWDKIIAAQPPEMRSQLPANASKSQLLIQPIATLVISVLFLGFGIAVRGGRRGPILAATILTGLLLGLCVLAALISGAGAAAGNPLGIVNACFLLIIAGVLLWQFLWLRTPLRSHREFQQAQAAYQAQYWQYMQAQQAYNQANYPQPQQQQQQPPPPPGAYPPNPYHAPPAGPAQGASEQTGWQWTAPPPPPPPPGNPGQANEGGPHGQSPQ